MRTTRSQRRVRPGSRPSRSLILGSAGGGGGALSSAGRPSVESGQNNSGSDAIFPANWGAAAGDAFLMHFLVESFTTFGTPTTSPTEGEVIGMSTDDDGTTITSHGLWFIPSYSGSGNPALNYDPGGGGTTGTIFQTIWYWDISLGGVTPPTQCVVQNSIVIPAAGAAGVESTHTAADGGDWIINPSTLTNRFQGPAITGIANGDDWIQGRAFGVGDDDIMNDTTAFYDEFDQFSSTGGSDLAMALARKSATAVIGASDGVVNQADIGEGIYAVCGLNFLLGT